MKTLVRVRRFAPGQCIAEPEQRAENLFILHSGTVEVRDSTPEAARLGPGEMFGEAALILGEPYRLRAVALSETEVVAVGLAGLHRLCLENPDFTFRLIRLLARHARPATDREDVSQREQATRLAAVILDLSSDGEPPQRVAGRLMDLSQASGVPIRDAYLWVQRWLEQRILRLADDQLSLVEPEALRAVAEPPEAA